MDLFTKILTFFKTGQCAAVLVFTYYNANGRPFLVRCNRPPCPQYTCDTPDRIGNEKIANGGKYNSWGQTETSFQEKQFQDIATLLCSTEKLWDLDVQAAWSSSHWIIVARNSFPFILFDIEIDNPTKSN